VQRIPAAELPTVTVPTDKEIERRALVTEHELYTRTRTKLLNRLHSLLHNQGITTAKRSELTRPQARIKYAELLSGQAEKEAGRILRNITQIDQSLALNLPVGGHIGCRITKAAEMQLQ
jgi:transposase